MVPEHRESRARRAWRDTNLADWPWRLVEGAVLLFLTFFGLRWWSKPEDVTENLGLVFLALVVTLILMPAVQYGVRYVQAGRRMAEERVPLDEVRRVIVADIQIHGAQLLSLGGTMQTFGVPFTQRHIAALRTLEANGEVRIVQFRAGFEATTGERVLDAVFEPVAERFK
jgi:hypothetical protein